MLAVTLLLGLLLQTPVAIPEVQGSSRPYIGPGLRVESRRVQVDVVVRDSQGRAVAGLTQNDFRVFDEKEESAIVAFAVDKRSTPASAEPLSATGKPDDAVAVPSPQPKPAARRPRFIALFFDDAGTPTGDMGRVKFAAKRFVEDGLTLDDRAAVYTSSLSQAGPQTGKFTTDKKELLDAIDKVQSHPRFSENGLQTCPRITPYSAYLIANNIGLQAFQAAEAELKACETGNPNTASLRTQTRKAEDIGDRRYQTIMTQAEGTWDMVRGVSQNTLEAIDAAIADLSRTPGNHMLLLVSSGFLTGTLDQQSDHVAERALRARVVINSLDAKGLFAEAPGRPFDEFAPPINGVPVETMRWENESRVEEKEARNDVLSELAAATGGLFFRHNNDYSAGFRELGMLPEITYTLSIRPDDAAFDGKYHKLKVRLVSGDSYLIEARPGYFATLPAASVARARFDAQVTGAGGDVQEFPSRVSYRLLRKLANGSTAMEVQIHVDVTNLPFPQQNGRHGQKLSFVAALLDKDGAIVNAREGTLQFAATDAKLQSMFKTGVDAVLTLEAPAGSYRLRAVSGDGVENRVSSVSLQVDVP